ncbi:MAG: hypothetical protein KQJ78_21090 [Deltaproteobacteria bacterium]|nr:hypothetical protein [Deltaproteobacteria bacterium]
MYLRTKITFIILLIFVTTGCIPLLIKNDKARHNKKSFLSFLPDIYIAGGIPHTVIDKSNKDFSESRNFIESSVRQMISGYKNNEKYFSGLAKSKLGIDGLRRIDKRMEIILVGGRDFICFSEMIPTNKRYMGTICMSGAHADFFFQSDKKLLVSLLAHETAHIIIGDEGDIVKGPVALACVVGTCTGVGAVAMLPLALMPPRVMGEEAERKAENGADLLGSKLVTYCGLTPQDYKKSLIFLSSLVSPKEVEAQKEIQRRIDFVGTNN